MTTSETPRAVWTSSRTGDTMSFGITQAPVKIYPGEPESPIHPEKGWSTDGASIPVEVLRSQESEDRMAREYA